MLASGAIGCAAVLAVVVQVDGLISPDARSLASMIMTSAASLSGLAAKDRAPVPARSERRLNTDAVVQLTESRVIHAPCKLGCGQTKRGVVSAPFGRSRMLKLRSGAGIVRRNICATANTVNYCQSMYIVRSKEAVMPTMNVNLTPEMAEFVESELATGDYASASELVRDTLRLLRRDRDIESEKAEILRRAIDQAISQAERREFSQRSVSDIAESVLREK
jgi:antitoxin ParD1/3/4